MDYVAVTLSLPGTDQSKDLLLPLDVPQYILVEAVTQALKLPVPSTCRGFFSLVENGKKTTLPWQRTLREAGLRFGQFVALEWKSISARASLVCVQGPEFDLEKDEMLIGCRSDMDIDLRGVPKQEYVSGRHAKIYYRKGCYYLQDLGSTNGTQLNGTMIHANTEQPLNNGDEILLGATKKKGIQLILKIREQKSSETLT